MIKLSSILDKARNVAKVLSYSSNHPGHETLKLILDKTAKAEQALAKATKAGDTEMAGKLSEMIGKLRQEATAVSGELSGLQAARTSMVEGAKPLAAATAAGAGGLGIGYMANRLAEPAPEPRFRLGSLKLGEWAEGFMDKCAEYGVDGASILEQAEKNAGPWGQLLGTAGRTAEKTLRGAVLGGGAILGGGYLLNRMSEHDKASRANAAQAAADAGKLEGRAREQWLTNNQYKNSYQSKYRRFLSELRSARQADGTPVYTGAPSYEDYAYHAGTGADLPDRSKWTMPIGEDDRMTVAKMLKLKSIAGVQSK